ncbi:MAG: TonB-dependent receptor [Bacteroidia bacterium]
MKFYQILICIALMAGISRAQTGLGGTVTDAQNKPLEAVHIVNQKGKSHAHSNELGRFFLTNTSVGDSLEINLLGYASRTVVAEPDMIIRLEEKQIRLDEVVIEQSLNPLSIVSEVDLLTRPVNSSQDLLRTVPGLIIGQHAGGGKAEQIFLRGFDIDHGTDIAISVDGMPVNMVSHAHGQGYSDLHFLIPETIEQIDFGKGPYRADQGNFATAGHINFQTKEDLETSLFQLEAGQFNSRRAVAMLEMIDNEQHNLYTAMEYLGSDGPFESSQLFNRMNIMGKYTGRLTNEGRMSLSVSHFSSSWDASGQIPQRAVDQGLITRFGAIDDTEGGTTGRTSAVLQFDRAVASRTWLKNTMYYSHYQFELFSNFTFFLQNPEKGDQIKQHESRDVFGFSSELNHQLDLGSVSGLLQAGLGMRRDNSLDNYLARTANRSEILEYLQRGDIQENNLFAYANASFGVGKFEIRPGFRIDRFEFTYKDALTTAYDPQSNSKEIISPKLNIQYQANRNLQLYLNSGKGFHSNDTRVVLAQRNDILPAALGERI